MSNVGDVVWANGKIWVKRDAPHDQKYKWHAKDDYSFLKDLKRHKDFDWLVFNGRRRFYTDSQVNQLIDQSEKLTEQINNQEQSIRSYQESLKYWGLDDLSADFETLQNCSEGQKETILFYQNLAQQFREERDAARTQADGAERHVTELIAKKQVLTREVNELRRKVNEAGGTMKLAQSIIDENNQLKQDINGILTNTADVKVKAYMSALDHVIEAVQEIKKDELNDPYYG